MKAGAKGFTLIELVVVITIIGILAAVAAPRFINVQSDARASVVAGVEASMRSAASLVYAKALIQGQETVQASGSGTNNIDLDNDGTADIEGEFGYPALAEIEALVDISGDVIKGTVTDGLIGYDLDNSGEPDAACGVQYAEPTAANTPPVITSTTTGC